MPVYQTLINNDQMFRELKRPPIIINDLENSTTADREKIEAMITTTYSSDMVSILPLCKCGATKGEFSRNTICEVCQTPVSAAIEDTIEPLVWFRKPHGVDKLFSPILWIMLEDRFVKGKYSILRWLTDTSYSPQTGRTFASDAIIEKLEAHGIRRGYNYFVQNFFPIIEFLLEMKEFRVKRNVVDYLPKFLYDYRDCLFSDHLPLINKSLLIIEKTNFATYIDLTVPMAMDAIEMLVSIDKDFYDQSGPVKENRTARALYILGCRFYHTYLKNIVARKPGLLRHYLGGSRFDFSARCVISSITGIHRYDEVEVPWGAGITLFRPMLINKLVRKSNMVVSDAVGLLLSHTGIYHPLIDHYLKEIIAESRGGRYPIIFNRFPSLLQGSIQRMYIPFIKTDPADLTLGISILCTTAPNADFDGDSCSIYLALDENMEDLWYPLSPKFNIWDMSEPLKISGNIKLSKPLVAMMSNWLAEDDDR